VADPSAEIAALKAENVRLQKIVDALIENAERNSGLQHSDFSLFQTAIMLEDQVNLRTAELQAALRDNERMTEALRASEERFRSLANQSMIGILTVEDGRIGYTNARLDAIFGYAPGALIGRPPADLVIDEDRAPVTEAMARQLRGETDGRSQMARGRRQDGSTLYVEVFGSVMTTGTRRSLIGLVQDVSDRVRDSRQIEQLMREQQAILNSNIVGFVKLKGRRFVWANEAFARMLGYPEAELLGRSTRLIHPDRATYDRFALDAAATLQRGQTCRLELQLARKDGSLGWYRLDGELLQPGSDESIWACFDVTERKAMLDELAGHRHHLEELVFNRTAELAAARDAAEAASRAKSMFLANMSHELRTPLNGIMGMTNLALRRSTDPALTDHLGKTLQSARQLLGIVDDVLDIARIEADTLTLAEAPFSLRGVLGDTLGNHEADARRKGLALEQRIPPALPDALVGDARRLGQIVRNLVDNAIKFSERGTVRIHAELAEEDGYSLLLRIEVHDQGIGVAPALQARLFQPFVQADGSTTRRFGGTGLGLIMVKRLARLMGGDAGMHSEPGHGSTFWLTARLRRAGLDPAPAAPIASDADPLAALQQDFGGLRVLIVDDDPLNQDFACFALEDAGMTFDLADSADRALHLAAMTRYGLVLLALDLGPADGAGIACALRTLPGMARVPILAMSSGPANRQQRRCREAGLAGPVAKPVTPDTLGRHILDCLRRG